MQQLTVNISHLITKRQRFEFLGQLSTVNCQLLSRRGQSLIEVVVSAGISVILAIALISTSLIVQKSARAAKNNTQATKLAQESIEQMRVFRDRKGFDALTISTCLALKDADQADISMWSLTEVAGCSESIAGTFFKREISIQDKGINNKLVTVNIKWSESGGEKFVSSQTILSKWEQ
ncbi:hypothetical protein A3A60_01010 [Candidatus Curtissbacteria bacterium RIFCSPLOWO2_01_FULL_42_26]|uniref:Type II secretion system protein GspI C-terminal domain-containing protein n=1 Tax=Candidatus Curtissbacteria bacterium RIFCSPLOWO2_01_FULL_42_26 TaxID=1797729 RepID=A0A1F5HXM5_9BACT|nr:MAG: hypothetical protein A3A60_01010 [Candidatus Curtissbacteria bacterium RIFCSPLOWO2_01_FULL_42_26]